MKASHRLPNDGSCMTNGHVGVIIIIDIGGGLARFKKKKLLVKKILVTINLQNIIISYTSNNI